MAKIIHRTIPLLLEAYSSRATLSLFAWVSLSSCPALILPLLFLFFADTAIHKVPVYHLSMCLCVCDMVPRAASGY